MAFTATAYRSIADLTLFLKTQSGEELVLADVPRLLPLRWVHFRDNWEFFRRDVENRIDGYGEPNYLKTTVEEFTEFIETQRTAAPNVNPFSSEDIFFKFFAIFDNVLVNSLKLSNKEQEVLDNEVRRIINFNRNDFVRLRQTLIDARDIRFDQIGLTDASYNAAKNRSPVPEQLDATIGELLKIQQLQNAIKAIDFILANAFSLTNAFVDPFALARANANNPDIDIANYQSGRLVRLNYGEDLQLLAKRQLGSPDRWIDIAIANGLKPPYIDEVGKKLSLISNGNGSRINIARTDNVGELNIDRLFINQVILLQSDTQRFPEQRTITNIRQVPVSGEIIIELDGPADLGRYKISENAHIRVFKPNTINSNFFILIPSQEPLPDDRQDKVPFFLEGKREDEKRTKVDLAIGETADLVLTPNSDLQLSFGLANAVQAIRIKMTTKNGSLRRHRSFGLVDVTGTTNNDREQIKSLLVESINGQIAADPRFSRIETIDIRYGAPVSEKGAVLFFVQFQVRLAGGSTVVPISFSVAI